MTARNVNLTDHLAHFIDLNVESGRFQNASEVVREALRLLEHQQQEDELKLEALRQAIAVGMADIAAGRFISLESHEIAGFLEGLGQSEAD
ncbi:type II toxin-antitoxin system ParD family antitoxin [Phenylobacterium aquaticum]|uniref:type II toxin-antitoxin system ParD family antitoxin n=1 Tax=Phenylobacterium aquaticum TaxID=1763816 RepID=UPI0026EAAD49|nr:type II toxin-antitoxin system ParD family antitoxin [Phenylobacterium aquaticum]